MAVKLVLASNSPRRRVLLALAGWPFRVVSAEVNEDASSGELPAEYVLRLAQTKARKTALKVQPDEWVVAADTTVAEGRSILGKPVDAADAEAMLRRLRGRTHQVFTALAIVYPDRELLLTDVCATDVPMRGYKDAEIQTYIATGDPFDKAGAYAIQHPEFRPVQDLRGCYASVMGLPLCHLARNLRTAGLTPPADIPQACQSYLHYSCPVYQQILAADDFQ